MGSFDLPAAGDFAGPTAAGAGIMAELSAQEREFLARNKSFVRRGTRLTASLTRIMEEHAAQYVLPINRGVGQTTVQAGEGLDFAQIFGRVAPLTIEIGSGAGDALVAAAACNPQRDYVGFEVWRPGLAKTVSAAVKLGLTNLRLVEADAAQALPILASPGAVAQEVWTFFPDPWQKARQAKRRLVNADFAALVAWVLQPGGYWRLATDWDEYAWQMRDVVEACVYLYQCHAGQGACASDPRGAHGGFAPRYPGRAMTRFEQRGLVAGRQVRDITAQRLELPVPAPRVYDVGGGLEPDAGRDAGHGPGQGPGQAGGPAE